MFTSTVAKARSEVAIGRVMKAAVGEWGTTFINLAVILSVLGAGGIFGALCLGLIPAFLFSPPLRNAGMGTMVTSAMVLLLAVASLSLHRFEARLQHSVRGAELQYLLQVALLDRLVHIHDLLL